MKAGSRAKAWGFGVCSLFALEACQSILGFEDFIEGISDLDGGAGDSGSESGGAGNSGDSGSGGSNSESLGAACTSPTDCSDALRCVYGFCREPCVDDTECRQGNDCLLDGTSGGCQLDGETCTTNGECQNADLVCGIDGTCRVDCSTRSCDAATQRCIASTCVSTVGERAQDWDCGGVEDEGVVCTGSALEVCNVLAPGLAEVATCASPALCTVSIPAGATYDRESPPVCESGCDADQLYCAGATLLKCKDDGSGPVDGGEACATEALCEASVSMDSPACVAAACEEDETRCGGGQTELVVQKCNDNRTGFEDGAICGSGTSQCNPASGACLDLDVDPTEVSYGSYQAWLDTAPSTDGQPAGCEWNTTFDADPSCESNGANQCYAGTAAVCPVVCVDWCDAYAYCAAQGRRLCGRITGGMNPFAAYADPGSSQWMNACTAAGQFEWGSGAAPDPGAEECTYSGTQIGEAYPVGSRGLCHSPSPGYETLFDLSGNVEEWEDSCEVAVNSVGAGADDACRTRGGSFQSSRNETRCDAVPASAKQRNAVSPTLGFRCCL